MTDLNKMWAALARYQSFADKDGHGESWRVMCSERTGQAAWEALTSAAPAAKAAALAALTSASWEVDASRAHWSALAIERIESAIKDRSND